jgi:hypothetical protein
MNWVNIKTQLPVALPGWYSQTHDCSGQENVLVFGYDSINFYPRYEVMFTEIVSSSKPKEDGRYIIDELIVTHWANIERPS